MYFLTLALQKEIMKSFIGKNQIYIIAEIGINHNGNLNIAKKLIDYASAAGCNAVKFQTYITDDIILRSQELASYQKITNFKNVLTQIYPMVSFLYIVVGKFND